MNMIQRVFQKLFGPYTIFVIVEDNLAVRKDAMLDDRVLAEDIATQRNSVQGVWHFSYTENDVKLCKCAVWYGDRYKMRNYWPLKKNECKLIDLETEPKARGKNLAPLVITQVSRQMAILGFRKIYGRVWHSNAASLRAFEKAGWGRHALVIDIFPLKRRIRMIIPYRWMPWT